MDLEIEKAIERKKTIEASITHGPTEHEMYLKKLKEEKQQLWKKLQEDEIVREKLNTDIVKLVKQKEDQEEEERKRLEEEKRRRRRNASKPKLKRKERRRTKEEKKNFENQNRKVEKENQSPRNRLQQNGL
eukprot:UN32084